MSIIGFNLCDIDLEPTWLNMPSANDLNKVNNWGMLFKKSFKVFKLWSGHEIYDLWPSIVALNLIPVTLCNFNIKNLLFTWIREALYLMIIAKTRNAPQMHIVYKRQIL